MLLISTADRERRTKAAWERFVSGDDDVDGVPSLILLSWQRSRDLYMVDPLRASPPRSGGAGGTSLLQDSVLTQLGGIAATFAEGADGALTTVTDGSGNVLGSWGSGDVRRRAATVDLAPMFTWTESATGTNAVGTALGSARPVSVRGPEHWCAALHDWNCGGISIRDEVTGRPIAVLNVSFWRREPGPGLAAALEGAVASIKGLLREHAVRDGVELVAAFAAAERAAGAGRPVLVVDVAGHVVAANRPARSSGTGLPATPVVQPRGRRGFGSALLREVVVDAEAASGADPRWTGVTRSDSLCGGSAFEVHPVRSRTGFIGVLLVGAPSAAGAAGCGVRIEGDGCRDPGDGDPGRDDPGRDIAGRDVLGRAAPGGDGADPGPVEPDGRDRLVRMVGVCDNRLVILTPDEIRYAEADRHAVWLVTDRGRLRAAGRGLDNIERELRGHGFLRVHRGYLVNVRRIREVDQGIGRGTLTVSTRHHGCEVIPVSRRHVAGLRGALGI